jgi:integrase
LLLFEHRPNSRVAEKTQKDYRRYLRMIEEEFRTMPLNVVQDLRARGKFKAWRDQFASTPRTADYLWTTLARVLAVAKDRDLIAVNVCERGGRLYEADRAEIIWLPDHIKAFYAVASPELQFALLVALWIGQRQGDLIRLTWTQYDGNHVRLRQGKTKKRVVIPVGATLKTGLDAKRPAKSDGTILRNTFGEAWTGDGFRASWGKAFTRAKLEDAGLHFHDLRGTAVTRLALSGCTVPQIAAITGHSPRDIEGILESRYLGGKLELAEQAIAKLDAKYG